MLQHAVAHHRDSVGHCHRFDLIVRDIDCSDARGPLQSSDLAPHLAAKACVQIGERFVHQKRARMTDQSASHRDALSLSSRELSGAAFEQRPQFEHCRRFADPGPDELTPLPTNLQGKTQVLRHAQMRIESVTLKNHGDISLARREVVGGGTVNRQYSFRDLLEAGDHAKRSRFAASGRSDQHQEFAVGYLQIEVFDRGVPAGIDLAHVRELNCGHVDRSGGSMHALGEALNEIPIEQNHHQHDRQAREMGERAERSPRNVPGSVGGKKSD